MSHIELSKNCTTASEDWSWLEPLAQAQIFPAGTELFRQGSTPQAVYLVDRGMVKLIHSDGNDTIVSLAYPGCALGDAATMLGKSHPTTAVTLTLCDLRCLQAAEFTRLIKDDATFSWQMHLVQSRELYKYTTEGSGLRTEFARRRLERLLRER